MPVLSRNLICVSRAGPHLEPRDGLLRSGLLRGPGPRRSESSACTYSLRASCTLICLRPHSLGLKRPRPRLVALLAGGFATAFQPSPAGDPCDENDDR